MKRLYLSAARQRMVRGETQFNRPSRFIGEIPRYLLSQSSSSGNRYSAGGNSSSQFGGSPAKTPYYGSGSTQKGGTWTPPENTQTDEKDVFANNPFITKGFGGSNKLGATTFDKVKPSPAVIDYGVGDTVKHTKFGVGIVSEMIKQGEDYVVSVDFDTLGTKKMKASFAKLQKL